MAAVAIWLLGMATPAQAWRACAQESQVCQVEGRTMVRYGDGRRFGTEGRYVYRDAYGGLNCNIDTFGSDPYPGRVKQCESRR